MKKMLWFAPLVLAIAASGCATKKFVRTEVGAVNAKVESLSATTEQMQSQVQQDEARIGQVDEKAVAAGQAAQQAQDAANGAAQAARQVETRVDQVAADVAAGRKLLYQVMLSEDESNFTFGRAELPDTAKSRLDAVIGELKREQGKDVYIEVEGHTDSIGSQAWNYQLGLDRAEAVQRYLYMQHQIPLHKIEVFSFGEEKPVASNTTRDGRAQNRRVVVRVLS